MTVGGRVNPVFCFVRPVTVTYMPLPVIVTWLDALFRRAQSTTSYLLYLDAILYQKRSFLK
jgi:hypothetical protein